jgi:diamine N-acetyltransferase
MWGRDPADDAYWIGGFIIDRRHQRKGLGRGALEATIAFLSSQPACREIALSYRPDNRTAKGLYERAGFAETGVVDDGEVVARRAVGRARARPAS